MKDGLIKGWGDGRIREWVTASTVEKYEYEARFMWQFLYAFKCTSFFFVDTSGQQQWLSRRHYRRFLSFYFSFPAYCATTVKKNMTGSEEGSQKI